MAITSENLIKRAPITVKAGTKAIEAVKIMYRNNIGSVVIVNENGYPVGIFTERDLVRAVACGKDLNDSVESLGTYGKLITVKPNSPIGEIAEKMVKNNIRHILVVDNEGKLVGVVSIKDIVNEKHVLDFLIKSETTWEGGTD
ncbi:CBS domain-containing protein [Sulfolobus tengchongensis]|uniref:CBS domain-containing protein n=1 Tax=Sulfolobus tengchongensis TaxID=207809 RepID=A0AAX4L3S4_9CREN